jgi:hypothetical protein
MFKTTPWIGSIVRKAISAYLETVNVSTGTLLSPNIDISSVPFGTYLPLIPDVGVCTYNTPLCDIESYNNVVK